MNKTDPLMAMIRQLTGGKAASRLAPQNAMLAKDHKGKVEDSKGDAGHFREQLRVLAQGAKQKPLDIKPHLDAKSVDMESAQDTEPSNPLAEVLDHVAGRPRDRTRQQPRETSSHQPGGDITSPAPEWRTPEAALSSMISKLDQPLSPRDDGDAPLAARSQARVEHRADLLTPGEPAKSPKVDVPEQRFASSLGAIETRSMPTIKVAVREQETHFQPVGQPTLLQKIVDRLAPDLTTAPAAAPATAADLTPPDMRRGPDTPIRMLTLQLDPPSMGTVTVRMRLAGDAVEVKLLADRPETAQLLREERGALKDAMQSAGYTFDIASIDHGSARHPTSGGGHSQAQSDQQQSQQSQGGSQFNNGASERQSSDAQAGTRHNRQGHDQFIKPTERRQDEEVAVDRNSGVVYL